MELEQLFEESMDFACCLSHDGYIRRTNRQWQRQLGWDEQALLDSPISRFVHADDVEACQQAIQRLVSGSQQPADERSVESHECRLLSSAGDPLWVSWNMSMLDGNQIAVSIRDISDWMQSRHELNEQTRYQELAANMAHVGYWEYNPETDETHWSDGLCAIFGVEPGDPRIGPEFARSRFHPVDREQVQQLHAEAWQSGQRFEYKARLYRPDGECRHIHTQAHCELKSDDGQPSLYFGVTKDITDHERAVLAVQHAALHDALTGLPNRKNFNDRLTEALIHTERYGRPTGLVLLDLDHFKYVNDTLGHPVGDELLIQVAQRLQYELLESETLCRLGGDEFAVIQLSDHQPADAENLCDRILASLSEPFSIEDHHLTVGCSIGIAMSPGDGADAETLLRNADIALYKSKADGRGMFHFFQAEMDARLRERRQLEQELKQAIEKEEFELYYQPVFDTESKQLCSLEALIRWNSPTRGMVPPNDFIPVAEQTGLIVPIGRWVVRQACQEATRWPGDIRVAVNVSATEFKNDALVDSITRALNDAKLAPSRLEVEITESALLSDGQKAVDILHRLRRLGIHIVMDDFGMGYSSLSYLRSFPFDKLKLDASFVKQSV
jgi:diguanylate cyclase (GGDEF)-like protein/PAS domain S-box-containing protein